MIPGRPDVAFDAPVEVDPGKDDHLHPFAGQLKRERRADKARLERELVKLVVAGLDQRLELGDQFVVRAAFAPA